MCWDVHLHYCRLGNCQLSRMRKVVLPVIAIYRNIFASLCIITQRMYYLKNSTKCFGYQLFSLSGGQGQFLWGTVFVGYHYTLCYTITKKVVTAHYRDIYEQTTSHKIHTLTSTSHTHTFNATELTVKNSWVSRLFVLSCTISIFKSGTCA